MAVPEGGAGLRLIMPFLLVEFFIYAELLCRAIRHGLILLIVLFLILGYLSF